jgi:YHS domain-containing protein
MSGSSRRDALRNLTLLIAATLLATPLPATAGGRAPLAIKGYDTVAYFTDGKPVRGSPAIEYVWDEYRYRFSSTKHLEMFKADPIRYAPQFANFCAMALSEGEVEEADPKYWLIRGGKLYLFSDRSGPKLFQHNLAGNISNAERNRALIQKN